MTRYGRHRWPRRAARAGVAHDRHSPDYEHRQSKDVQYGGCDLATAGPNTTTVNAQEGVKRLIAAQITR